MIFVDGCQKLAAWLSSLLILLACLKAGEQLSLVTGQLLPGSIMGMLLLAGLLATGLVRLFWVESGANFLVRWMALLFVPVGVGVVEKLDLLASSLGALILTCILGTGIVIVVTGWFFQWLERCK